jgi:hypothetical protein
VIHSNPPTIAVKDLPSLTAAATVVHLTFGLTIAPLVVCCLRAAYQTATRRDITLISAQHTVVWCLVLCLDLVAMGVFEYTLGRHHSFVGAKDDEIDAVFGKKSVLFNIRLSALPPDPIKKHFGRWKYVAVAPATLGAVFMLEQALLILASDPSKTSPERHRHRARESFIVFMASKPPFFVFVGFFILLSFTWLWLAVFGMFIPGSAFAPASGIKLAELDQTGTLVTVLLVQMLRVLCFAHQKWTKRGVSGIATARVDEETATAELGVVDT